jgi:epoxyqueuosine reductase
LTIEHDGMIDEEFRAPMGNRIFGCDDCLAVCPWNRFASLGQELKLQAKDALTLPPLTELLALDEDGFKKRFAGTPVRRAGVINFKRNVLIAIGNSNNPHYISALKGYLNHDNEVIKATAIWAIKRLSSPSEFAALREQHLSMQDSEVIQQEWQMV